MTNSVADITPEARVSSETVEAPAARRQRWGWLRQIATVAHSEYRLAIRRRWALALAGLFALFGMMLVTFSGSDVGPGGAERLLASLTNLSVYLVPLAALAFGYDAIVGRDRRGWLELVFSLPVSRSRVVAGAYLGRAVVLAGAAVIGFGLVGMTTLYEYGTQHWTSFLAFVGGATAAALVFLSVAFFISAVAKQKTHALGFALLVWVWFVLVHDLMALGAVAAFELPEGVLTAFVLANPASVFRVFVLEHLGTGAGGGFAAAFAEIGLSTGLMVGAMMLWCIVPVAAAALIVGRRRVWRSKLGGLLRGLTGAGVVLVMVVGTVACFGGDEPDDESVELEPVTIEASDTCEACGMIVGEGEGRYGPNGQVFFDEQQPVYFDSIRELFHHKIGEKRRGNEPNGVFVTDYSRFDFEVEQRRGDLYITGSTRAESFVEPSDAVFAIESDVRGAMGADLLPFSNPDDAAAFADEHGGRVVDYDQIDEQLVNSL